jgi:predicted signal transduction protein with EAL and GGDEF domain
VRSVIELGASLNMSTCAEGVETEQQFNQLQAAGDLRYRIADRFGWAIKGPATITPPTDDFPHVDRAFSSGSA